MLQGKKILLAVTGSIAAYKSAILLRLLIREGAEVRVVMTSAARDFITPLTLSTLSKHDVISDLFQHDSWTNHVMLGRWADVMVVAPLSCNTLAKMANGLCDNVLMATWLSATCPVMVAPAMDEDMWKHPATRQNLERLEQFGVKVIPVENGELASGLTGEGRMAEPETIVEFLNRQLANNKSFSGKRILISAGPTQEPLDPVRYISNRSSGKMGLALAREFSGRGAAVTLVLGPVATAVPAGVQVIRVQTAAEMYAACLEHFEDAHVAVMAAAVADYTPMAPATEKIRKSGDKMTLELQKTNDILQSLGGRKHAGQLLVGFALETDAGLESARSKLRAKNADIIILNSLLDAGAGFGHDTNKITIVERDGSETPYPQKSKQQVAADIVDRVEKLLYV